MGPLKFNSVGVRACPYVRFSDASCVFHSGPSIDATLSSMNSYIRITESHRGLTDLTWDTQGFGNVDSGAISPDADLLVRYCTIGTDLPQKPPIKCTILPGTRTPPMHLFAPTARATRKLSYGSDGIYVSEEPRHGSRDQSLGE